MPMLLSLEASPVTRSQGNFYEVKKYATHFVHSSSLHSQTDRKEKKRGRGEETKKKDTKETEQTTRKRQTSFKKENRGSRHCWRRWIKETIEEGGRQKSWKDQRGRERKIRGRN